MHRLIFLIGFIFHWNLYTDAQVLPLDTILNRIQEQMCVYPQEKLYIQTDRNVYIAGDTAWMKAYVVDAMTHQPVYRSRYVYVELINPFNRVETRIKLRQDSLGMIYGNIALQDTLPSGNYTLRAYTRFMENEGKDYFFRKQIRILNPLEKSIQLQALQDEHGNFCIDFINKSNTNSLSISHASVISESRKLYFNKHKNRISLPHWNRKDKTLLVKVGNYQQYVSCDENISLDYEVSFMPEGGELIPNALCKVAFKSINSKGLGEDITGTIVDETGDTIVDIRSFHKGMGFFSFIPTKEKTYRLLCYNKYGLNKTFSLPKTETGKYALKVSRNKGYFFVSYLSEHTENSDSLVLLVHQRGIPKYLGLWLPNSNEKVINIDSFKEGIINFMLLDTYGNILSERLAFVSHKAEHSPILRDSIDFSTHSKVCIPLYANDKKGNPLNGHASIAITDNSDIKPDSLSSIQSSLLLTSELKGYVEEPHWYFQGTDRKRQEALDVLMLTQGWRRYNLQKVIKEKIFDLPRFSYEKSMEVKGQILSIIRQKPKENALVWIMAPSEGFVHEIIADEKGRFTLQGFEFPDSTTYIIMAQSAKGKDNVVLKMDEEVFPSADDKLPIVLHNHHKLPWQDYLKKVNERLAYENGIRHIFMDEVVVTAPQKKYQTNYEISADKVITEEMIKKSGASSIEMLLRSLVGFRIFHSNTLYVLDETPLDGSTAWQVMSMIRPEDIQQIDIIRGMKCAGYFGGKQDAIVAITLKSGGTGASWDPVNITHILPLGYQKKAEFYAPKYEIKERERMNDRDLRTTIHWQPDIVFKEGKAEVVFYTSGIPTTYSIVVEGVTEEGYILREVKEMVVH